MVKSAKVAFYGLLLSGVAVATFFSLSFVLGSMAAVPQTVASPPPETAVNQPTVPPTPAVDRHYLVVKPDDTLGELLSPWLSEGQSLGDVLASLEGIFDVRGELKPGQRFTVATTKGDANPPRLEQFTIDLSRYRQLRVDYVPSFDGSQNRWLASRSTEPTVQVPVFKRGPIKGSFGGTAQELGIPSTVTGLAINVLSFSVDFQRDIWQGSELALYYDEVVLEKTGEVVSGGDLHYVALRMPQRSDVVLYRFDGQKGAHFYDEDGQSGRRLLLATPIDGARISSGYGMRHHPILGYTKMHRGIDFAIRSGTPVMSAGDGKITAAGRNGAYGKMIKIRHANGYRTLYAHLAKIYVRKGSWVKQGQIIGTSGATGRVTGPHLHYEILYNNRHINPAKLKLPPTSKLKGDELKRFLTHKTTIEEHIQSLVGHKFAVRSTSE